MITTHRSPIKILRATVALAIPIFFLDVLLPRGQTTAMLFVAVIGATLWLPGLRPVFVAAFACTLLTILGFLVSPPGPIAIDLINRFCSIIAFWQVALFCVLYKRSEQDSLRLASIVESAEDAIFSTTLEGIIVSWNGGAEKLFGYTAEEVQGRPISLMIPLGRLGEEARIIEAVRRDQRVEHIETLRLRKDGRQMPVSLSISPVRDAAGKVVAISSIAADITERERAEEALRESEERFRLLLDSTGEAIYGIDLDGRCTFCNPACLRLLGYAESRDLLGEDMHRLIHHTRADGTPYPVEECRIYRAFRQGEGAHVEDEVLWRADGTCFPAEYWAYPVRRGGDVVGSAVTFVDITRRKRADEELRRAKRMADEASQAKSEFLANMSHEIRTPMNGILGMTELALDTQLSPQQREYLGLVQSSADALLAVINDVLDFSKIEAGKLDLEVSPFGLRVTVEDTLRALAQRAHAKGLELACRIAPDVPDTLAGDSGRLRQVLVNLVGNAIKFTEQGEIVVTVEAQPRSGDSVGLRFTVADTGIGIPADKRRAIFEPFEQADGSTTRKYGGTGLGLTISSKLIALMDGRISVDGEVGRGSTFQFTARFAAVPQAPPDPTGPAGPASRRIAGLPVLIVDDNQTNRRILEEILTNWGARPTAVDGGPAALARLREAAAGGTPFAVALLDGMMPGMDGFALAGRIRSEPELAHLVLVMLTSWGPPLEADRSRDLGIAASLVKPVRQSELFDALMRVLNPAAVPGTAGGRAALPGVAIRQGEGVPARSLCILLAEDHAINQKIAVRMLDALGHTTTVVGDGREAVAAWQAGTFDLILMDVQMPEMDGFEAVAAIRERERRTGGHVPVIALTAHAMKGDRERCLGAGMDGYLAKPLKRQDLSDTLALLVAVPPERAEAGATPGDGTTRPRFQFEPLYTRCGDDAALVHEVVASFLDAAPRAMADIEAALAAGDYTRMVAEAHGLKGICLTIGAEALACSCRELEEAGSRAERSGARSALAPARGEWAELQAVLATHLREGL